jgi:hypothetical protein
MIDGDALLEELPVHPDGGMRSVKNACLMMRVRETVKNAPTVDVLQKLWNALYAEEDKLEKRYFGTQEHDNWFLVYRPWLQDGFGIAIKVLSEILVSEPPEEGEPE